MRSPNHPDEHDLDVAGLRRTTPQITAARKVQGGRRGRKGIGRYVLGGLVVLVLALFSGVVWFAYQDLMPGGDEAPPLIRADASPIKREPDERGGLPLVNEESAVVQALDEPDSPVRVERIMPREPAAPRSTADVIPDVLEAEPRSDTDFPVAGGVLLDQTPDGGLAEGPGDTLDTLLAEIVDGQDAAGAIEPSAGVADLAAEPAAERADADELPLPADGIAPPEREVAALATPAALPAAAPPAAAPPTGQASSQAASPAPALVRPVTPPQAQPATAPTREPPAATAPTAPPPAAQAPAPATAPATTQPAETTVAALPQPVLAPDFRGAFGVQLLAVRDEAAAAGAWSGLQQQHPTVLGSLRSRVQRAEIGGSTFYRLQAGPFADRASASAVCSALQARGTDCFIVEPTS